MTALLSAHATMLGPAVPSMNLHYTHAYSTCKCLLSI